METIIYDDYCYAIDTKTNYALTNYQDLLASEFLGAVGHVPGSLAFLNQIGGLTNQRQTAVVDTDIKNHYQKTLQRDFNAIAATLQFDYDEFGQANFNSEADQWVNLHKIKQTINNQHLIAFIDALEHSDVKYAVAWTMLLGGIAFELSQLNRK